MYILRNTSADLVLLCVLGDNLEDRRPVRSLDVRRNVGGWYLNALATELLAVSDGHIICDSILTSSTRTTSGIAPVKPNSSIYANSSNTASLMPSILLAYSDSLALL